jgi:hypothetical protein
LFGNSFFDSKLLFAPKGFEKFYKKGTNGNENVKTEKSKESTGNKNSENGNNGGGGGGKKKPEDDFGDAFLKFLKDNRSLLLLSTISALILASNSILNERLS